MQQETEPTGEPEITHLDKTYPPDLPEKARSSMERSIERSSAMTPEQHRAAEEALGQQLGHPGLAENLRQFREKLESERKKKEESSSK